ncbi:MAG: NAD(P)-binding domain-containing protein [Microthrixaceae bacterium]
MSNIGFVGLGIMGTPMAGHLIAAGHQLYVYDCQGDSRRVDRSRRRRLRLRRRRSPSRREIIITMVPDTPHVAAALFDAEGVAAGLSAGKIVVDMSSISPVDTKVFAQKINALGCDVPRRAGVRRRGRRQGGEPHHHGRRSGRTRSRRSSRCSR